MLTSVRYRCCRCQKILEDVRDDESTIPATIRCTAPMCMGIALRMMPRKGRR